jgi:MarR family 2-MHQ and catechol resistance regulon transcriptional repressor
MSTRRGRGRELALQTYVKLMRAADSVQAPLERRLESLDLTEGQFGVLEILLHLGPQTAGALGRKSFRSGGNVTTVLDNLERRKLVIRERLPEDRRSVRVSLTPAGRRLIGRIFPAHAGAIGEAMAALTRGELAQLGVLLKKLGLAQRAAGT